MSKMIQVEVAYAKPERQQLISFVVPDGSSIKTVIEQSGILHDFPEIDLNKQSVGIFSELRLLTDNVKAGDRVEIYRPLEINPMEARRRKAKKKT